MRVGEHLRARLPTWPAGSGRLGGARLRPDRRHRPAGPRCGSSGGRAFAVVEGLRRRRVLAGRPAGGHVLKVRPPLIWGEQHADHFVDALAATLAST